MKKAKNFIIALVFVCGTFLGMGTLHAECSQEPIDYECWCDGHYLSSRTILSNAVKNYKDFGVGVGNNYILCFSNDDGLRIFNDQKVEKPQEQEKVIIYGAVINLINPSAKITLSGNISLVNATLSGQSNNPLIITGSDVEIIDSTISTQMTGISINGGASVSIMGTAITGPGKDVKDSVAIDIANAKNVLVTDNIDTIRNFDIGIRGAATIRNTTFENVNTLIANPGPIVDMSKVGKTLDDSGEYAKRIAGKAPECLGGVEGNGVLELYIYQETGGGTDMNISSGVCPVKRLLTDERLCIFIGDGVQPKTSEEKEECFASGKCICFSSPECIFDCGDIIVDIDYSVLFTYTNTSGSTYAFSTAKDVSGLPPIVPPATLAPTTPAPAPVGDEYTGGGTTGGTAIGGGGGTEVYTGGDVDGGGAGGAFGLAKGCSLARTATFAIPPFIILLVIIAAPIAQRVRVRVRRIGRRRT